MRFEVMMVISVMSVVGRDAMGGDRDVQMTFMFSRDRILFVNNLGDEPVSLDGWRFSTSSASGVDQQTDADALDGLTLGVSEGLRIYLFDNAPAGGGGLSVNASDIGGFAPYEVSAYAISLYAADELGGVDFDDGMRMVDHLQWSLHGVDNDAADERSDEAVAGGLWTDESAWIDFRHHAYAIENVTIIPGEYVHGPENFNVIVIPCEPDTTDDGILDIFDVFLFIELFGSGDSRADLISDGVLDVFDVFRFVDQFNSGCLF